MKTTHAMCARFSALLFILFFSTTIYAGSPKVEVCHVPPGNPDNFHTIKISEKALGAHLAHGDLAGACSAACAELCDDGNACTVDDFGDCETNGCPVASVPVDCSDGNLCTDDICDPSSGCSNPTSVTCEAVDLCSVSACDPVFGVCEDTPKSCDEGESCNPDNGNCEPDEPTGATCPCFTADQLTAQGSTYICDNNYLGEELSAALFDNGNQACSGDFCSGLGNPSCGLLVDGSLVTNFGELTDPVDAACRSLIADFCASASASPSQSSSNNNVELPGLPFIQ